MKFQRIKKGAYSDIYISDWLTSKSKPCCVPYLRKGWRKKAESAALFRSDYFQSIPESVAHMATDWILCVSDQYRQIMLPLQIFV